MHRLLNAIKDWLPVVGLTFSTFIFNTTEFIPIGLLTSIATDLKISEAQAGMLISVYAWFVALMSLPLILIFSRTQYRNLLLGTIGVFIISHLVSAWASNFTVLMISRIGVASCHSIFWAIVSPMAVAVAPKEKGSVALSMIVAGSSIAMIIGLPLGRMIGLSLGWRISFLSIAIAAIVVFAILLKVLPKLPTADKFSLKELPSLLKNSVLVNIYILTLIIVMGHFTAYSFIEPFLKQVAGFSSDLITFTLTMFGMAGIIGSVLFSCYYTRYPKLFILYATLGITIILILLRNIAQISEGSVLGLCIFWGIAITMFNLFSQAKIIQVVPKASAIAMAIFSGIYNLGIGSGALLGGLVSTYIGIDFIGYVGSGFTVLAFIFCIKFLLPAIKKQRF